MTKKNNNTKDSLKFFNVKSDEALRNKINDTWDQAECPHCHKKYSLIKAQHSGPYVICPHCKKSA